MAGVSMGREANIYSIRALEKQIVEGDGDIIELKRARNSLLNISTRVPPEILGMIFSRSLVREAGHSSRYRQGFDRLRKGSHNFLLVCNHWFEVASRTPELWSFWGNTLEDWKKRHLRSGTTPVDLVLEGGERDPEASFDKSLRDAVRGRVMQDTIRQVHLASDGGDTVVLIISALTPANEGARNDNIESIRWENCGFPSVDVSKFFARSRLSNLRSLHLLGDFRISSWDHLTLRTTLLTSLSLEVKPFSPTLSTSQLVSILTSNRNLRQLRLSNAALPNDADGFTLQVPLCDLKILSLGGEFRHIFGLLHRLILPEILDSVYLSGDVSTVEEITQLLPYLRDHLRRDPRFQERLEIKYFTLAGSITISINALCAQDIALARKPPSVAFTLGLDNLLWADLYNQVFADLVALAPCEHVVSFKTNAKPSEELLLTMPNIETLSLYNVKLSEGFLQPNPDGPHANKKLLPSLRSLCMECFTLEKNDWNHLTTYLAHQTSDGQAISLEIGGLPPKEVMNEIKGLVKEFDCYPSFSSWLLRKRD